MNTILTTERARFEQQMHPHKIIQLGEIIHMVGNIFKLGALEIEASDVFASKVDKLINVSDRQIKIVKSTSGDNGVRNFKNYMTVATNREKSTKVVVMAGEESRKLIDVIPLVDDYISPNMFFDFMDMFLDKTKYEIERIESGSLVDGLMLYLQPISPVFSELAKGEEFMSNGIYVDWNLSGVEIGSYFSRLVCKNGQMVNEYREKNMVYSLNSNRLHGIIESITNGTFHTSSFNKFADNALLAIQSRASIRELGLAQKILLGLGAPEQVAEELLPYSRQLNEYRKRGMDITQNGRYALSDLTVWEVYNNLTQFATHTDIWSASNLNRGAVMLSAVKLLSAQRDIINYANIY